MLVSAEGHQLEGHSSVLHDEELKNENSYHDKNEEIVDEEVRKDIYFRFLQFPCIEEVENLKEHKYIEEKCQVHSLLRAPNLELVLREMRNSKELVAFEEHDGQDDAVVDTVEDDSSPHLGSNDVLMSGVRHSCQKFIEGWIGGQGQSCKGVHDQVDPKHLNWGQGGFLQN